MLSLAGLVFALILFEVGFRITTKIFPAPVRWNDRPQRYYLRDNSEDKPNLQTELTKNENVYRILVLGDSFTFGQGVHRYDAYPSRLETLLNLSAKVKRAEVINWGIRGYSTVQEFELLKKGISKVKPDLLIVEITLNDPEIVPYRVTHPYLDQHGHVQLSNPIFHYWRSLRFIVERIINTQTRSDYEQYYFDIFNNPDSWGNFQSSLANMKALTDKLNIPMFAVVFPLFSHTANTSYPFIPLHKKIKDALGALRISSLDLLGQYKNVPADRLQVIPGVDSHPNEIAQRIAADAIYRTFKRRKTVPDDFLGAFTKVDR